MRPELELIEKIEQYLKGQLSATDKLAFEKQIADDPSLLEEIKLQEEVMKGIERAVLKQKVQTAGKRFRFKKNITKWGFGGLSILVVLTAALLYYNSKTSYHYAYKGKALPEYNELGEKQWTRADSNISAQTFLIDASKDTVIETKGGIVMAVPANSFVDENGNPANGKIELVVKEALDPATMMTAGLSTKSGNDLLESGGMFFIDARKNGKILKIDPSNGIYAEIPTDNIKPGMQLFNGKRMPDGTIDWVNPKSLEHDLVPENIQTLNFYPPLYLDSLQRWGYDIRNKGFTDSLYYSFASLFSQLTKTDSVKVASPKKDEIENQIQTDTIVKKVSLLDGRTLFMSGCASCHKVFSDMIGPHLGGVLDNDYYKGDIKKMTKWIHNPSSMVGSDPYYMKLKEQFGPVMTSFPDLSEKDIASIFDYINKTYTSGNTDDDYYYHPITCGINPAKIKAIWNEKFQNTILATREFEERLRIIHLLMRPDILDLYVNNLDKNLSFIDSLADLLMPQWEDSRRPFHLFALRHDGKVKNGSKQFELLRNYYNKKTKAFTEAITKTQNEFWNKQNQLDNEAYMKNSEHEIDSANRIAQNFTEEFDLNLKEAYKQLGYDTAIKPRSNANVYKVQVTTTGWCNVDRYVYESTINRSTFNYTDTETGKKAVINYQPISIQVGQWNEYDQLYVYLLPDKLSSFMRLNGSNGRYSEKMDELMNYKLVCIAYKKEKAYFYSQDAIQPKDYFIILTSIGRDELNQKLNSMSNLVQTSAILKENEFFQYKAIDQKRQTHNQALQELRDKLRRLFFACGEIGMPILAKN